MKLFLVTMITISGFIVHANEIIQMNGQQIVLLSSNASKTIEIAINDNNVTFEQRIETIRNALYIDSINSPATDQADAGDGFCGTAAKLYAGKLSEKQVSKICFDTIDEKDTLEGIASGEMTGADAFGADFNQKLSFALSGYILLQSKGGF